MVYKLFILIGLFIFSLNCFAQNKQSTSSRKLEPSNQTIIATPAKSDVIIKRTFKSNSKKIVKTTNITNSKKTDYSSIPVSSVPVDISRINNGSKKIVIKNTKQNRQNQPSNIKPIAIPISKKSTTTKIK